MSLPGREVATVILAAGLGTRMKSSLPKILHKIYDKTLIQYVADSIKQIRCRNNIVVLSPRAEEIKKALEGYPVRFAIQKEPKGTGDALKTAARILKGFRGTVLVLNGDTPLISASTLQKFLKLHKRNKEDISIMSFIIEGQHSYGRVIRQGDGVKAIIEDKDADIEQKKVKEVNSGIYAMQSHTLGLLNKIKVNPAKGEHYLTDIVGIAVENGYKVGAHILGNETELTGINTREDLHRAGHYLRDKVLSKLMDSGVSFLDKTSVFIHPEAKVGRDTLIYHGVHIEGESVIGKGCTIYPNTRIVNSIVGNNVTIKDSTVIESSIVKDKAIIGPFAHLRPGAVVGSSSKIGNFVEVKRSVIGSGTKASHLSYIGDAEIGENVNIGAGTITCNYDGRQKHKTIIEDNVFVGSDTQLVAPVRVGKNAYVGAGSTITTDVPSLSLAISRARQRNIEKWALKRQKPKDR